MELSKEVIRMDIERIKQVLGHIEGFFDYTSTVMRAVAENNGINVSMINTDSRNITYGSVAEHIVGVTIGLEGYLDNVNSINNIYLCEKFIGPFIKTYPLFLTDIASKYVSCELTKEEVKAGLELSLESYEEIFAEFGISLLSLYYSKQTKENKAIN